MKFKNHLLYGVAILLTCNSYSLYAMMELKERYAWPSEKPNLSFDPHSMFNNANAQGLREILHDHSFKVIVELGSWMGASTRFLLDHAPQATVIAVDHWQGSPEHHDLKDCVIKLPILYESFISNCWSYKHRLVPMKKTTIEALEEIHRAGITPDLIYVDAAHDYDAVLHDLETIYRYFPSIYITGDDWGWPTVRNAVVIFAEQHDLTVVSHLSFWRIVGNRP